MAMAMRSPYDAPVAGGTRVDAARGAGEEMAGYDNRFARIQAELVLLKWMAGLNLALAAAVLAKLLV